MSGCRSILTRSWDTCFFAARTECTHIHARIVSYPAVVSRLYTYFSFTMMLGGNSVLVDNNSLNWNALLGCYVNMLSGKIGNQISFWRIKALATLKEACELNNYGVTFNQHVVLSAFVSSNLQQLFAFSTLIFSHFSPAQGWLALWNTMKINSFLKKRPAEVSQSFRSLWSKNNWGFLLKWGITLKCPVISSFVFFQF